MNHVRVFEAIFGGVTEEIYRKESLQLLLEESLKEFSKRNFCRNPERIFLNQSEIGMQEFLKKCVKDFPMESMEIFLEDLAQFLIKKSLKNFLCGTTLDESMKKSQVHFLKKSLEKFVM